jgi:hypothetical protein
LTLRASPERRRVAAQIGLIQRHHGPDAPQLVALRRRLDELRVAEVIAWAAAAQVNLPGSTEIFNVHREVGRMLGNRGEA